MEISFKIEHIDPLGQGVSKIGDRITFIKKALPGEEGRARIYRSAKGVHFAEISEIHKPSPIRISPLCPHYQNCNGCDFLHTNYQEELKFKLSGYQRYFPHLVALHPAQSRFGYRNRIQLHSNNKQLGFINSITKKIEPVPSCQLPLPNIQAELEKLYTATKWKEMIKGKGHLEIYQPENAPIRLTVNQPYSAGGFSQVNPEMNKILTKLILENQIGRTALDLFGGDGNLSYGLSSHKRWVIDRYKTKKEDCFINCNLFSSNSLKNLSAHINEPVDLMIVDPPRSGFLELNSFIQFFKPKRVIYVSCNIATQARDIKKIDDNYQLQQCHLVDLFPGTAHFESIVIMDDKL